jgi:exonuclease VII small subunit
MGHGLRGDELEQTYQQARGESDTARTEENKPESDESGVAQIPEVPTPTEQDREPAKDREPVDHSDRVSEAADRLRRAKQRLEEVEAKTGQEVEQEEESSGLVSRLLSRGLVSKFLLGQTDTETTVERTEAEEALCRECREEVKAAERELEKALEHEQVDRRYARTDT